MVHVIQNNMQYTLASKSLSETMRNLEHLITNLLILFIFTTYFCLNYCKSQLSGSLKIEMIVNARYFGILTANSFKTSQCKAQSAFLKFNFKDLSEPY